MYSGKLTYTFSSCTPRHRNSNSSMSWPPPGSADQRAHVPATSPRMTQRSARGDVKCSVWLGRDNGKQIIAVLWRLSLSSSVWVSMLWIFYLGIILFCFHWSVHHHYRKEKKCSGSFCIILFSFFFLRISTLWLLYSDLTLPLIWLLFRKKRGYQHY